jgi:hypothetical protein
MTKQEIATLFARVEQWPEAAQAQLAEVASAIEAELRQEYVPTPAEIEATFAKHRRT